MAGHVYVSYDGQDVGYVRRLVDHLAASWLTVWVDKEAAADDIWYPDLEAPIRAASVVLVVMSPASQNSERVRAEITYAHRIGRPIIPLLLAGRPFFTQSGNPPEYVIGGLMPEDELIDRIGELSQTPITHRKSGKPGRGSASRERESIATTSTSMAASMRSPGYPLPSRSVDRDPYDSDLFSRDSSRDSYAQNSARDSYAQNSARDSYDSDDDDPPRRFRPAVLAAVAGVFMLAAGVALVVLLGGSGSSQPSTPLGASNVRTSSASATATSGPPEAALTPPATIPSAPTSTTKKPTTTTSRPGAATTTTSTITTTDPPPIPGVSLSLDSASIAVSGSTTGTVALGAAYGSDLTVTLTSSTGVVTIPGSVSIPAGQTTATFAVNAGPDPGSATLTGSLSGHSGSVSIEVTAAA